MSTQRYVLEVYTPGRFQDVLYTVESSEPFLTISRGDLLNPRPWNLDIGDVLRVTAVEHVIWERESDGTVRHKLMVFTRAEPDVRETRER